MLSQNKPYVPPPMYPQYPKDHRPFKPKGENNERLKCCSCFQKRKQKVKPAMHGIRKGAVSRLEFWSVYGVPYLLVSQGVVISILSPAIALMYKDACPGLPFLYPVLMSKFPLVLFDATGLFLITADSLNWNTTYYWIGKISDKLNWRIVAGMTLTLFVVWSTVLFIATNEQYANGQPVSNEPDSPRYCHVVLHTYARASKYLIVFLVGITVITFLFGGVFLLCLVCIVSRISGE